jgi:hypothetical protein
MQVRAPAGERWQGTDRLSPLSPVARSNLLDCLIGCMATRGVHMLCHVEASAGGEVPADGPGEQGAGVYCTNKARLHRAL